MCGSTMKTVMKIYTSWYVTENFNGFFFLHGDQSHETILIRERMRKLKFYFQIRWTVITNCNIYQ